MAEKKKERGAISQLLDFAGSRKSLTYLGCALSAISIISKLTRILIFYMIESER